MQQTTNDALDDIIAAIQNGSKRVTHRRRSRLPGICTVGIAMAKR